MPNPIQRTWLSRRAAGLVARWIARLLAIGVVALFAIFVIGEGIPKPSTGYETALTIALTLMITGLIAGWWLELTGALLILTGFVMFAVVERSVPLTVPLITILLAGILFGVAWALQPRSSEAGVKIDSSEPGQ